MAIPGNKVEEPEEQFGALGAHVFAMDGDGLIVTTPTVPWTYMVNPARWQLWPSGGIFAPVLLKATWAAGVNGNGARMAHGEGYIASMQIEGWVVVSHQIAGMTAFGETRKPTRDQPSTVINRWAVRRQRGAAEEQHYTTAWRRPIQYGPVTYWEHDIEGELASRLVMARSVLRMDPTRLPDPIANAAARPVESAITSLLAQQTSPVRDAELRRLSRQLPESILDKHPYKRTLIAMLKDAE
jgi:hypothetical protein